jgi:hypothetical protein
MTGCFTWLALLAGGVFLMLSLIRWFEQTAEAVDLGWWNKLLVLVVFPFAVWFYPARVKAGRPVPVPRHEPVRGFGVPKEKRPTVAGSDGAGSARDGPAPRASEDDVPMASLADDGPPPGTPPEFLGKPVIPPKKKSPRAAPAVDPDKVAKLRQKMREQGMLPPDDDRGNREG